MSALPSTANAFNPAQLNPGDISFPRFDG